jgi:hypothetical protein
MAIQYRDNTFSETMPCTKALERFNEQLKNERLNRPKALFVADTEEELEAIKQEASVQEKIDELNKRMDAIEKPTSLLIDIPTDEQVKAHI